MAGPQPRQPFTPGSDIPLIQAISSGDKQAAMALYNQATRGTSRAGTGPFSRFFQEYMAPIVLAALTAESGGIDDSNPKELRTMESVDLPALMAKIQGGLGSDQGLFSMLGGMGQRAMGDFLAGDKGDNYEAMKAMAGALSPLMSAGLNPIYEQDFYRQQQNTFADMYDEATRRTDFGEGKTDWDDFFANSDFGQQYYGPQAGRIAGQKRMTGGGATPGGLR